MDDQECHEWARIFKAPWESLVVSMSSRARALGLSQEERDGTLVWSKDGREQNRWLFVQDPSDDRGDDTKGPEDHAAAQRWRKEDLDVSSG